MGPNKHNKKGKSKHGERADQASELQKDMLDPQLAASEVIEESALEESKQEEEITQFSTSLGSDGRVEVKIEVSPNRSSEGEKLSSSFAA